MRPNLGDILQVIDLLPVAAVTASANATGVSIVDYAGEIAIVVDISAPVAGSSPTMDIKIQESDESGANYTDVSGAAITQVTSAASVQKISLNTDELKKYIRVVKTIGGTSSPQYLVSVKAVGVKKYV